MSARQATHPQTFPPGYYLAPTLKWPRRIKLLCSACAEEADAFSPHLFIDVPDIEGHRDCQECGLVIEEVPSL